LSALTRSLLLAATVGVVLLLVIATPFSSSQAKDDAEEPYNERLFTELAFFLEGHYLDPERILPRDLLTRTFATLENSVDEIFVDNSDPDKPFLAVNVGSKVRVFNLNEVSNTRDGLKQAMRMLKDVFAFLENNYTGDTPLGEIQYDVINGFLGGLDPHTLVFSPKAFREFFVHIEGEIFGVGMYVGTRDGKLRVIEVLKETPAARAGFKKGDLIARIGDESTINMTVQEAVERIRGPLGSRIVLTVKRQSKDETGKLATLPISVERNRVVIKSVESALVKDWNPSQPDAGSVGYLVVKNFDKNTNITMRENLARLSRQNEGKPLAGLILDLRGNSGGLLTQAIEMCDFFLESGSIVSTASRGKVGRRNSAKDDGVEPAYPIIALANSSSASGAEIVVGALQKNHRAVLLGTPTFGKGSVQQLHQLSNEAQLKITVSEYLLPGEISIQENGVVPDIQAHPVAFEEYLAIAPKEAVEAPAKKPGAPETAQETSKGSDGPKAEGEFNLFPDDRHPKERDYEGHIVSRFAKKEFPKYTLSYFYEPPDADPDSDAFISGNLQPEKDKLVQTALRLLGLAKAPFRADEFLTQHKEDISKIQLELFDEIVEKLKERGIDWSPGPTPKAADLDVQLNHEFAQVPSPDEDDVLPINEVVITARVTNRGDETIYRLKGLTESEYFIYKDREFLFGKLAPGETVERRVRARLPYFPHARNDLFEVKLSGESGTVIETASGEILLSDAARPGFAYSAEIHSYPGEDKTAAEGALLTAVGPGEHALLQVKIKNTGGATAHKGIVILRNETGRQVFLNKGRIEFDALASGAETTVAFDFEVRTGDPVDAYEFELVIVDSYSGESLSHPILIPSSVKTSEGGAIFVNGKTFAQPLVEASLVDPETGKRTLVTNRDTLEVRSLVRSTTGSPIKSWIMATLLNSRSSTPDKIVYTDSQGKDSLKLSKLVPIRQGVNLVTVFAKDQDGLEERRSLVVRRP